MDAYPAFCAAPAVESSPGPKPPAGGFGPRVQAVVEARASVQEQPAAYLDEHGWRQGQRWTWLWTAVTAWVTVLVGLRSRHSQVAQALLGERFWGNLVTDRWSAYTGYPTWRRKVCTNVVWFDLGGAVRALLKWNTQFRPR